MSAARWPSPLRRGIHHHAGEPRRQRQSAKLAALVGDAALRVDRAELDQQRLGFGQRARGRRIEKRERRGIGRAPLRQIEQQARQIGGEDFRPRIGFERRGLRLVPQPVADAGLGAAGAAAALIGCGARHPHGLEPGDADVGLVARHARKPAVDDDAHALDGERGFGDRGREHHLAPALWARAKSRDPGSARRARRRASPRRPRDRRSAPSAAFRCGGFPPAPAGTPAPSPARRAARAPPHRRPGARWARGCRGRDSASRPETPGLRFRPPAHRRAALRPARRRASPTSRAA